MQILAEISALRAEVAALRGMNGDKVIEPKQSENNSTKGSIIAKVKPLVTPQNAHKRYTSISQEQISKETNKARRDALQMAHDYLSNRRLLNACNRPHGGWKFDFQSKSIELLYRLDKRASTVYNTRHRPLAAKDGIKERANAGEKYALPYGMEKIDYSFKTIFVTEGIFDSCFLKNCLAYSNWILPTEMSKVIDIFREAGFQIIHILDNFRLGDKGGVKGLEHIVTRKEWLAKGDKVFSWEVYSDCDDLNEIAMVNGLDEIDPQVIISNSWNEEEARAHYKAFLSSVDAVKEEETVNQEEETLPTRNQDDWSEILSADKVKQHVTPADKQDEQPHHSCSDEELEAIFEQMERDEQRAADEVKEREHMKKRYEEHLEQEMWEMEKTTQAIYNPQSYLWKTPGITISPSKL